MANEGNMTINIKTSDIPEVKEALSKANEKIKLYEKVLDFYATCPRSCLHEDGGQMARDVLKYEL